MTCPGPEIVPETCYCPAAAELALVQLANIVDSEMGTEISEAHPRSGRLRSAEVLLRSLISNYERRYFIDFDEWHLPNSQLLFECDLVTFVGFTNGRQYFFL